MAHIDPLIIARDGDLLIVVSDTLNQITNRDHQPHQDDLASRTRLPKGDLQYTSFQVSSDRLAMESRYFEAAE
ncbi:uncharacterized protein N7473_012826 [Penicillium subrubescens]|uniref:Uncharacterized protein n=1 Tax=Penicillium subrubescens TaxID=1316194 RepID=A0A1Q5T4D6_9EURO|nr:uncharacterized protein N7473_012826 [Penicillium subrubescens]KAJ5875479.1 hypothetical protein N7473_012826 [Penicillium subrubescens]OKO95089.1 hypothetical protein PENSUB_11331 [Penicillium subrubescens]